MSSLEDQGGWRSWVWAADLNPDLGPIVEAAVEEDL